jgi:nucleotide-binding universal stress UspA family protein
MYRDLIIGFDDSPPAHDALAFARRLALATGARPMALYASRLASPRDIVPDDADSAAADADVDAKRAAVRALMAGVPGATFEAVADGSPAHAIHRAAEDADAALIVLGATHRTGARRTVPGTTADAVIHGAPCAVAIAPARYADTAPTRPFGLVAAAVDGGDETERVARVAARIACRAGGSLRVVTVADLPYTEGPEFAGNLGYGSLRGVARETAATTLDHAVAAAGSEIEIDARVAGGEVADAVARESADADLLVIGSRGYGPLRRVVLGSSTGKILHAATCPVLVVPRRTAEELDDAVEPFGAATLGPQAGATGSSDATPASGRTAAATSGDGPAPAS